MSAHLAVAIVAETPARALELARTLPPAVSLVEYRLDMMRSPDVALLAAQTPVPAIFTSRPKSQGGGFEGTEVERLRILRQGLETGHLVDIEMETLPLLADAIHDSGRIIGSQHDFGGMLGDWAALEMKMRGLGAGVVKLVGMARNEDDALPPAAWLARAGSPGVGIAMGAAGVATRLLAPRFPRAFLTFASLEKASAPGQIHVREMIELYGFQRIANAHPLLIMLTPDPPQWEQVQRYRQAMTARFTRGRPWLLPIPVSELHPGLMLALRLAGATGVFRLSGVRVAPELQAYGFGIQDYAWDFGPTKRENHPHQPDPDEVMTFLSQGN